MKRDYLYISGLLSQSIVGKRPEKHGKSERATACAGTPIKLFKHTMSAEFHNSDTEIMVFVLYSLLLIALSLGLVVAFVPKTGSRWMASKTTLFDRINTQIDQASPKVVNNLELKAGEKCVVCRCWKSAKFPLCDGSHVKHNEATGDNVGPAIIAVAK